MHYCGVVPMQSLLQLALIEEVRDPEPPVRLSAPLRAGSAEQVAEELRRLEDVVVGLAPGAEAVAEALGLPLFGPDDDEDAAGQT